MPRAKKNGDEDNNDDDSVPSLTSNDDESDSDDDEEEENTTEEKSGEEKMDHRMDPLPEKGKTAKVSPTRLPPRTGSRKRKSVVHYSPEKLPVAKPKPPPSKLPATHYGEGNDKGKGKEKEKGGKREKGKGKSAKKQKTEPGVGVEAMMELMREMLQKQSELIDTMHQKAVADTKDGTEVTAKKPPQPNTERKKSEDGFYINDGERFVHIEPTWQWRQEGEHDMERLMRTNLQFARLIDENAELRREKLLRDMVIQAENKKK